ncbi:MAG TPA: hypothetical protein VH643_09305 [Gemmataceae bacterium]|jgi:hypothetical protein
MIGKLSRGHCCAGLVLVLVLSEGCSLSKGGNSVHNQSIAELDGLTLSIERIEQIGETISLTYRMHYDKEKSTTPWALENVSSLNIFYFDSKKRPIDTSGSEIMVLGENFVKGSLDTWEDTVAFELPKNALYFVVEYGCSGLKTRLLPIPEHDPI